MKKRQITSLTLGLLASTSVTLGFFPLYTGCGALEARASHAQTPAENSPSVGLDAKCLQLANHGDWAGLVERLQTLSEGEQSPSIIHAWLAFALMFQDKQTELNALSQKVQSMPSNPDDVRSKKLVEVFNLIGQKKLDEASKLMSEVPDSKDYVLDNLALAALSAKTGHADKAIEYCQRVVTLSPSFAWGYRTIGFIQERSLKNLDAADDAYQSALAIQPEFKEVRDLLVDLRLSHNDFDGAIDAAQTAIKANPRDASNYYRLSQILTQQWRLREADVQLDKAIKLAPNNARYHRAKASILRYEKRLADAIVEQQKAVDLSSDKAFELTELAALNELAGNDSAAADDLKQALQAAPANQAAYQSAHQKLVELLIRGKRYDDLVAEFKRALQLQPDNSSLHLGLADAEIKVGKIDEAMKELVDSANLDNRDPRPHRMLGTLLLQRKEYPAAAKAYTRALNINPGSVEDLVALGYTYALDDDYMQAETAFVTALALQQLTQAQGSRADVMRSLATLLLSEGRYSEAAQNYEEILRQLKNSSTEKQDAFLLAESKALRDRTTAAAKNLLAAYDALSESDRSAARAPLVEVLLKLGKYDRASEQLSQAPESIAQAPQWLTLQARAARLKGDLAKAEEFANKAIALKDENNDITADAYVELGAVLLSKGDLSGADTALHKAADLNGKSFTAYETLARVYLKRKDTQHALEACKRALEINPYYVPAYLLSGDAYLAENKPDQALTNYKRAVELYPALLDGHKSLRDTYKKLTQKDEVKREEETITQLEKDS